MRRAELFGPPGVGKTTLATALQWRPSTTGQIPLDTALPPHHAALASVVVGVPPQPARLQRHIAGVLRAIQRDAWLSLQHAAGVWLLDESLCQGALLLSMIAAPTEALARYLAAIPLEGLTVFVCEAPAEELVSRGEQRGRRGLAMSQAPGVLEACASIVDVVRTRGADVRRVDLTRPVPVATATIRAQLEAMTDA